MAIQIIIRECMYLKDEFPNTKIVVATNKIKDDIISGFSTWMESVGWLDAEPNLKPKTAENPDGFDYEGLIHVLKHFYFHFRWRRHIGN